GAARASQRGNRPRPSRPRPGAPQPAAHGPTDTLGRGRRARFRPSSLSCPIRGVKRELTWRLRGVGVSDAGVEAGAIATTPVATSSVGAAERVARLRSSVAGIRGGGGGGGLGGGIERRLFQ